MPVTLPAGSPHCGFAPLLTPPLPATSTASAVASPNRCEHAAPTALQATALAPRRTAPSLRAQLTGRELTRAEKVGERLVRPLANASMSALTAFIYGPTAAVATSLLGPLVSHVVLGSDSPLKPIRDIALPVGISIAALALSRKAHGAIPPSFLESNDGCVMRTLLPTWARPTLGRDGKDHKEQVELFLDKFKCLDKTGDIHRRMMVAMNDCLTATHKVRLDKDELGSPTHYPSHSFWLEDKLFSADFLAEELAIINSNLKQGYSVANFEEDFADLVSQPNPTQRIFAAANLLQRSIFGYYWWPIVGNLVKKYIYQQSLKPFFKMRVQSFF
jgi:hypothetical protein